MSKKDHAGLDNTQKQGFLRNREKTVYAQNDADLRVIMNLPEGRRFLYRLAYGICGVEDGIWEASAAIHYREGRRSVGIEVKNEAQRVAPRDYIMMIQEHITTAAHQTETRQAIMDEEEKTDG